MLEETDTLLALAEVAAAFAGFAALVSVLRHDSERPLNLVHDLMRLRLVIASGVAGVAAALIPVGLAGYGFTLDTTWRVAACLFVVFDYAIVFSFIRSYRPVRGRFPPDVVAVVVVTSLEVAEQTSLFAVVLGLPFGNPAALYVTALIANICQAGFIFVRFVGSALAHPEDPE